jgi:hypothetical protein
VVRHFTTAAERVLPRAATCHANRRPQLERYVIAVRCKKSGALELRHTRPKLMLVFRRTPLTRADTSPRWRAQSLDDPQLARVSWVVGVRPIRAML